MWIAAADGSLVNLARVDQVKVWNVSVLKPEVYRVEAHTALGWDTLLEGSRATCEEFVTALGVRLAYREGVFVVQPSDAELELLGQAAEGTV